MSFCRFLILALGCGFVSLQAEIVALYTTGADRSRGSERRVWWLAFLEAAEFSGGVEFHRIAILALKFSERFFATL